MQFRFTTLDRSAAISQISSQHYDLAIIGGGITGAGIALDAASRGLKVILVEKEDFASGTSSRSTKLIHGGLRYLKQLEFGLVKEVGSERAIVHKLAPHLVIPEKMLLPLAQGAWFNYWITSLGLKIYDWLAGVIGKDKRRMLTRAQTVRFEPLLSNSSLKAGAIYAEYRTDDARLTLEILKTAHRYGAHIINYMGVQDFLYNNGRIEGIKVRDQLSENELSIKSQVVVNAAGPWVDELRELNKSKSGKRLHLTKGVHIVVPHLRLPVRQAIYFDVGDGRMIFAIPRARCTYIGTTDTTYAGDKNNVYATREDVTYLLQAVNAMFSSVTLTLNDVESSWAGLRPLIHEEGRSASAISRKDEIFESISGLISIAGGKLTGYRKMAERVTDLVIRKHFHNRPLKKCYTHTIPLTEKSFHSFREVRRYLVLVRKRLRPMKMDQMTSYLVENYGMQTELIMDHVHKASHKQELPELLLLKAELWFAVNYEMAVNLKDFFIRRTGQAYFNIGQVNRWKSQIADEMARLLGWSDSKKKAEEADLARILQALSDIK